MVKKAKRKKYQLDDSDYEENDEVSDSDSKSITKRVTRLTVNKKTQSKKPSQSVQKTVKKRKLANKIAQVTKKELKKSKEEPEDEEDKHEYSSVVCKLKRICKYEVISDEIKNTCHVLKQVQLEAWHVANLHLLRCLKNEIELPEIDQTFFRYCCTGVIDTERKLPKRMDVELKTTLEIYRSQRKLISGYRPPYLKHIGASLSELALQMRVNAEVMIAEHFGKRLVRYVQLYYNKSSKEAQKIVRSCYKVTGPFTEDEMKVRRWLGCIPYKNVIQSRLEYFVEKLYEMLTWMEICQEMEPNMKGCRVFSLLPCSNSYAAAHIKINGSTLHGICARIFDKFKGKKDGDPNPLGVKLNKRSLAYTDYFQENRDVLLRRAFDISQFETGKKNSIEEKRTFAHQITTNGYSASILLKPAKTEKTKKDKIEFDENYNPSIMIGIDPGMRTMCTAVIEGHISFPPLSKRKVKKRTRRKRKKRNKKRKQHKRKHQERMIKSGRRICEISTKEYRHLAGMNKARFWHEGLMARNEDYATVVRGIPSYKTASYDTYLERLKYFWKHVNFLLEFCAKQSFLKWRFYQFRMKAKAMNTLAKRIVPIPGPQVCIAYGDWSRRDGIPGHAPTPVKGFKRELQKRATVISMDEYRTSQLCSDCYKKLQKASYRYVGDNNAIIEKKDRYVLRCINSDCKATFWNRDVNAAINILSLLKTKIMNLGRLIEFCR